MPTKASGSSSSSEVKEASKVREATAIFSLNTCLQDIQATPYTKRKARQTNYTAKKVEQITSVLQHTQIADDGSEMIGQLKEKFHSTPDR